MSLEKGVHHGKEHRKPHAHPGSTKPRAKDVDWSCRNHGSCQYCREGRLFNAKKRLAGAIQRMREYLRGEI